MTVFKAACVQMRSSDNMEDNIRDAANMIRDAARQGAQFIATPENTTLMAPDGGAKLEKACAEGQDPALPAFRAACFCAGRRLNISVPCGLGRHSRIHSAHER